MFVQHFHFEVHPCELISQSISHFGDDLIFQLNRVELIARTIDSVFEIKRVNRFPID